jgi:hypothetical protein
MPVADQLVVQGGGTHWCEPLHVKVLTQSPSLLHDVRHAVGLAHL